ISSAGLLDNWKGQVELGGSRSTGSSKNLGAFGSIELKREGLAWQHKIHARADLQSSNDVTTAERLIGSYQPSYRFAEKVYSYGLVQYEHDPFAGYHDRYTVGAGIGYAALDRPTVKLDLEGGPAFRRTDGVDGFDSNRLVGRGSL